jgi:hypothetical protein
MDEIGKNAATEAAREAVLVAAERWYRATLTRRGEDYALALLERAVRGWLFARSRRVGNARASKGG